MKQNSIIKKLILKVDCDGAMYYLHIVFEYLIVYKEGFDTLQELKRLIENNYTYIKPVESIIVK